MVGKLNSMIIIPATLGYLSRSANWPLVVLTIFPSSLGLSAKSIRATADFQQANRLQSVVVIRTFRLLEGGNWLLNPGKLRDLNFL